MNAAAATQRNSRWTRSPTFGPRKTARLSSHDIEIFTALARYRYLPADYIRAIVGGSLKHLIHRLNILSREPNLFINRPKQQRANASANCRPLIYKLDHRGAHILSEQGIEYRRNRGAGNFAHELMICQIMASFELGARETGVRFITWDDIIRSENLPDKTRQSPKPFHIPISVSVDGHQIHTHVAADGNPFGIARPIDERLAYYFFPGIEADCGTEPVNASDFARSSIYKKFVLYLAVEAQDIHRSHFGFPNFYVPVITTNETRARSMMDVLSRITSGAGSKIFLFKTFPAFTSFEKPDPPSGRMLTEDWQRVGNPPFNFLTS
jgi:hypothetical protein